MHTTARGPEEPGIIIPKTRQPTNKKPSGGDEERSCAKEGMMQQTTLPPEWKLKNSNVK
jgi:hypothetical protein